MEQRNKSYQAKAMLVGRLAIYEVTVGIST